MTIDERVVVFTKDSIKVDGKELTPPAKWRWNVFAAKPPAPTWGARKPPSVDDLMARKFPEPDPGIRVLAEILATAVFSDAERERYFEPLCAFLLTLPPPDVLPEFKIRANELRQHCGVQIGPAMPPAIAELHAPADEPSIEPPPLVPPPLVKPLASR